MPIEEQVLTLTQWLSPAYPVGAFAYSHGLEWAVESQQVTDTAGLESWLKDVLRCGAGQSDARFLVAAYHAGTDAEIVEIDAMCRAFASTKERLMETDLQGAAFCEVTNAVWAQKLDGLTYPVAVGCAAKLTDLPLSLTTRMFLQAFVSNLVAAGMRLVPIGQTEGQNLIRSLAPLVSEVAEKALTGTLDDLSGTAFLSDIDAMKHEVQYSRMFRT